MENNELLKRAEDLRARCEKNCSLTHSLFLTPAERYELEHWAKRQAECRVVFFGGGPECERVVAFFLPFYMEEEGFDASEYIAALKLTAHFGQPGHRDYMGAILGMGIGREWLGDILVSGNEAWVYCMPSVHEHLMSMDKVGRCGVKTQAVPLEQVPLPQRQRKPVSFTVMSMRLDAVAAGLFHLSRSECVRQIQAGKLSLNYQPTLKCDASVGQGDILSLKGVGKAEITGTGGASRKGRLYVYGELYK